jgi:phage gp36-like protein
MPYCTLAEIVKRIPEKVLIALTDDEDLNPAAIDPADPDCAKIIERLDGAIADADATVDAYCQGRYPLPLSPVPPKIRQISADIAAYNIHSRGEQKIPEVITDRNKWAVRFLEKVLSGEIGLGVRTPEKSSADLPLATGTAADRVFSRQKLKHF